MRYSRLAFKIPEVKFLQVSAAVGMLTRLMDHVSSPLPFAIRSSDASARRILPADFGTMAVRAIGAPPRKKVNHIP